MSPGSSLPKEQALLGAGLWVLEVALALPCSGCWMGLLLTPGLSFPIPTMASVDQDSISQSVVCTAPAAQEMLPRGLPVFILTRVVCYFHPLH